MTRTLTLLLAAAALAGCGNTITQTAPGAPEVGPPAGARVTVAHGDDTTEYRLEGTLVGLGADWVGVEAGNAGEVLWVPTDAVRTIRQHAEPDQ